MFCLSLHWPRDETGKFKNKVYVLLQKQKQELLDITGIIELLELRFGRKSVPSLAIALCIGGNDFLPKFSGHSHEKWLLEIIQLPSAVENFVEIMYDKYTNQPVTGSVNEDLYLEVVRRLYCPSTVQVESNELTLEVIRQVSIKLPYKQNRDPPSWMPPKSALLKVIQLVNCQIDYLMTASKANADLPDFFRYGCLRKDSRGTVMYDFGSEVKVENVESLLIISDENLAAILTRAQKPIKKSRKKRPRSSTTTPVKPRRRNKRPMVSTPVKSKKKLPT